MMVRRSTCAAFAALMSFSAGVYAAAPQPADIQQAASKVCSAKLDRDNFPSSTMEDCVADQSAKLLRAQKAGAGAPQTTAGK